MGSESLILALKLNLYITIYKQFKLQDTVFSLSKILNPNGFAIKST